MGRTDSSSRTKSSKKKTSKGYRKKKSRRNKSKKLRHRDDSCSSFSDDESTSSSLNSSSGSEGEYKRKRVRSRSQSEIKGNKKRNRRRSLSEDSSEDSSPVKKRKRSKTGKKIKKKKKKSKRVAYLSSASSDSGSCSTCKDEDSNSDQLGSRGGSRGRSREKKKDHRDSAKARTGNRKNMSKTRRSFSPCSSDELGSQGRSRSRSREKKEGHRDSTKGRTGNRMNTSKDVSSFSPSRSYDSESMEKVTVENNPMRLKSVITVANLDNKEDDNMKNDEFKEETVYDYDDYPSSKSNDSVELVDRFNSFTDKTSVVKEVNSSFNLNDNMEKENNVSGNTGSEVDNLELILRQKALENLSKFRGGNKSKPAVPIDDKPKSEQSVVTQSTRETASLTPLSQPVTHRSRFTWRREPSVATVKDEKAATYSELHSGRSQPAELKLQTANISSTSRVDNEFVNETSKTMANVTSVDQKSTVAVETQKPSSDSIEESSSKEQQNEGNDNSQFEKKTMSVMRGGEMVQVSYKVYIPNRAPALARRQLKR
ncbi:hypothetical protein R6Q59_018978 [Mikania micrantha]